jgi:hypothetical protein
MYSGVIDTAMICIQFLKYLREFEAILYIMDPGKLFDEKRPEVENAQNYVDPCKLY